LINLTREEAQQVLDALEGSIDAQQWEIDDHVTKYGEWYRPQRVEYMKKQLANTNSTIEKLRAKLSEYPENFIDALKFHTAMQELEPEPVATQYKYIDAFGNDYWTDEPWEGKKVEAERYLYTAPPQREWVGLTDEDIDECWPSPNGTNSVRMVARIIEAKLKEKNA
jgi:hypothetical protein